MDSTILEEPVPKLSSDEDSSLQTSDTPLSVRSELVFNRLESVDKVLTELTVLLESLNSLAETAEIHKIRETNNSNDKIDFLLNEIFFTSKLNYIF